MTRTVIATCLFALALSGCAAESATSTNQANTAPGETGEMETGTTSQATGPSASFTGSEAYPPEVAAWTGENFFPNEFCWKIDTWPRSMPRYWEIRRYCDRRDNNNNLWAPN